jgi:WD40 repeat protein
MQRGQQVQDRQSLFQLIRRSTVAVILPLLVIVQLATAQESEVPIAHLDGVSGAAVQFNTDGKLILTAADDHRGESDVQVWDGMTFEPILGPHHLRGTLRLANFTAGGRLIFALTNSCAQLRDSRSGKVLVDLPEPRKGFVAGAVSQDGSRIAVAMESSHPRDALKPGEIQILDGRSGTAIAKIEHPPFLEYLSFSFDGSRLMTVEHADPHERIVHVWSFPAGIEAFEPIRTAYDFAADPSVGLIPATFSPDGQLLAIAGDHDFGVYASRDGRKVFDSKPSNGRQADQSNKSSSLPFLEFTSDSKAIFTYRGNGMLWDAMTGKPLGPPIKEMGVFAHIMSPHGRLVLASYSLPQPDGTVDQGAALWDLTSGKRLRTLGRGDIRALALSNDGHRVATSRRSQTLIWDLNALNDAGK